MEHTGKSYSFLLVQKWNLAAEFFCKSKEESSRKLCDLQHRVVQLVRSGRGHLMFSNNFSKYIGSV